MQKRNLGKSGLTVAPLAFGCNVFGWTADQATAFKLLDAFVDSDLNLLDTADVYPVWHPGNVGGESETIIGNWLKKSSKRDQVIIATKVGMKMAPALGTENLSRKYIFDSVEKSLKRLQIETIDLYQAHTDDPVTPLEETLTAFDDLIKQGKVRAIGASNYSGARLKEALAVSKAAGLARYESLQPEYNLYDRAGYELELEPLCHKEHLGVISYFSLARGFLSGKYRSEADLSQSPRGTGVKKYLNERGFAIVDTLHKVAKELHSQPARIALAWLIARPGITAPIASATTLSQLEDLIAAAKLTLSAAALAELDQASQ
ncbi:MAG: aldo/keto reductase [Candidatus Obscuribacter sp.]|jgi:aryl-alcohol dehydrogenase-like predicted oxidoreductase|nr:aldo/keto reductase [Candidatus Obscuribacter sp.]MBP6351231.1 aldo/keto reductase [Candidatus Obscuribacter sp.]MBP6592450.1 aldo/keto reductase [Candidatus Obscuribacter sp.]MBP7575897.1 aldo/keto reductase [Candidatus Obscuribacter sp.]